MLVRYRAHLHREVKHKWFVFVECCKLGIPFLGLIHDWSKFSPAEFVPYAKFYYDEDGNQLPRGREGNREFCYALLHHFNNNKHHPDYWVLGSGPMPIPDRYRREMIADWYGYERTNGVPTREYYLKLRDSIVLHPDTRAWVECTLGVNCE